MELLSLNVTDVTATECLIVVVLFLILESQIFFEKNINLTDSKVKMKKIKITLTVVSSDAVANNSGPLLAG